MYRIINGAVYGVLNDFDLASFRDRLTGPSSNQRTGTPPFMAIDILKDEGGTQHMYRHDLESIFYVMVVVASRHMLVEPKARKVPVEKQNPIPPHSLVVRTDVAPAELPLQDWFNSSMTYHVHGNNKEAFLTGSQAFDLSSSFEPLRPWLDDIRDSLRRGILTLKAHIAMVTPKVRTETTDETPAPPPSGRLRAILAKSRPSKPPAIPPYNHETLNGDVTYEHLITTISKLKSPLQTLRFRYEDDLSD